MESAFCSSDIAEKICPLKTFRRNYHDDIKNDIYSSRFYNTKVTVLKILFKQKHLRTPLQHRRKLLFSVKLLSALNLNSTKRWTHLQIFFWVFRLLMIVVICRYWYNLNKWHSRKQNMFKVFVDRNIIQIS